MRALVLEEKEHLSLRDIEVDETLGTKDVRIELKKVGICGSDVHYYTHGAIGSFVVRKPMILGHEASGIVVEVGSAVTDVRPGDRVCMEPGVPDNSSRASRLGMYNLDPKVKFWATPPVHGVMRSTVVHPADFTFRIPDQISFAEAAMVEPLAVGMNAAQKACIRPGDRAVVIGAGTIGMVTVLAALAGGCSEVFVTDVLQPKLDIAATLGNVRPINVSKEDPVEIIRRHTDNWGADIVFEASGNPIACALAPDLACPGGRIVWIGMPIEPFAFDVTRAQVKELRMATVFRYAHVFPRAIALIASGRLDPTRLITDTYSFEDSITAYDYATNPRPETVKIQIDIN